MDLIQLLVTVLVAFGGAYFGGKQALKNYYSQRWWDRKADAYIYLTKRVREILELIKQQEDNYFYGDGSVELAEQIRSKLFDLISDLELDIDESSLFISENAYQVLFQILTLSEEYHHLTDTSEEQKEEISHISIDTRVSLYQGEYKRFMELAKEDLNIRDQSRTDYLIDWASNLIKSFKQRYRLGSSSS